MTRPSRLGLLPRFRARHARKARGRGSPIVEKLDQVDADRSADCRCPMPRLLDLTSQRCPDTCALPPSWIACRQLFLSFVKSAVSQGGMTIGTMPTGRMLHCIPSLMLGPTFLNQPTHRQDFKLWRLQRCAGIRTKYLSQSRVRGQTAARGYHLPVAIPICLPCTPCARTVCSSVLLPPSFPAFFAANF